ncbi:hypothetical protein ES705_16428 [subsurface metagenome]
MNLVERTKNRILNWHNDQLPREGPTNILTDMLDEVENKLLDVFFYGKSAYVKEMRDKLKAVFAEMRGSDKNG